MRPTLQLGSKGSEVQQAQRLLGVEPDGDFGAGTRAAVIEFQTARSLTADGIIGPATWQELEGGDPSTQAAASWGAHRPPFILRFPAGWLITSGYGPRGNPPQMHNGVDIAGPDWTPNPPRLLAPCSGRVVGANADAYGSGFGCWMDLSADGVKGLTLRVAHLASRTVNVGHRFAEGAVLGVVGNTGYSFGTHLHAGIYEGGKPIDPQAHLRIEDVLVGQ